MQNWLLQNLSDVLNRELAAKGATSSSAVPVVPNQKSPQKYYRQKQLQTEFRAQSEWRGAIAAVEQLLLGELARSGETISSGKLGLVFAGPVPLLGHADLVANFQSAVFTQDAFKVNALMPCRHSVPELSPEEIAQSSVIKLPLIPQDPISLEQFCLVLTASFGLIMVLGQDSEGNAKFHFSFDPETLGEVWATLRSRLVITNYSYLEQLDALVEQFAPALPDYQIVTDFSRQLLQHIPESGSPVNVHRHVETVTTHVDHEQLAATLADQAANHQETSHSEMELLQALTHEVRTPLTTIRTLTKLLLKRHQDFKPKVVQRLQTIDRECTEQIERMELFFRAAELESTPPTAPKIMRLVSFPLEQVFNQNIPRWQDKARRRSVELEFALPTSLPKIVSDPEMLDTVLTGLMESCSRSLPTGGRIDVKVSTAGNQLKLQVLSQSNQENPFKSLGQLLNFQPSTGCLSLNLDATKSIFQALGGKLTVRQRQEHGKELTIFLPLGNTQRASQKSNKSI